MDSDDRDKVEGVSLVVNTPPPPKREYVLTLDEKHAEFLFSLLRRVQVCNEAGQLSYDIYSVLSDGGIPFKGISLRVIQSVGGGIEVDYND